MIFLVFLGKDNRPLKKIYIIKLQNCIIPKVYSQTKASGPFFAKTYVNLPESAHFVGILLVYLTI